MERPVVIELGAGIHLPAIRRKGESLNAPMIRINPADAHVRGSESIGLEIGALAALTQIWREMGR